MRKTEIIDEINRLLGEKQLDDRIKPLIKLYFLGKTENELLTLEQMQYQINLLCDRIKNIEFSEGRSVIVAYEKKANILTINKHLFLEGKSDEAILPIFMKFEQALNQNDRDGDFCHIEDFIKAGRIAKTISAPISDRLYKLYEFAECICIQEDMQDKDVRRMCSDYNKVLNEMIVTGEDNRQGLLNGANLLHSEVFTREALNNTDFEGPYKTEEYKAKAAKVLACIYSIQPKQYSTDIYDMSKSDELKRLYHNLQLFTGCTNDDIKQAIEARYSGDERIGESLEGTFKSNVPVLTEATIVDKVQGVIDSKPQWDSRIKHLIIPFFIRSQKIYGWSIDEFQERLNELNLKIDKIMFEELESLTILGDTAGDAIRLNSIAFLNKNGNLVFPVSKTLFHELGHITDACQREGVMVREQLQKPLVNKFYEWTNTISDRLVSGNSFYKKRDAMQLSRVGYNALAPLGSMVSCALGIPESEFAQIKDKGKDYEDELLTRMFPGDKSGDENGILGKVEDIFNMYLLSPGASIKSKRKNQDLSNQLYLECIDIMKRRIQNEIQREDIKDMTEYKKYQSFYLKKLNFNFKLASKSSGFRFSRLPIVHDIGFCNDKISRNDLLQIADETIAMTEFGFDNTMLEKYSRMLKPTNETYIRELRTNTQEYSTIPMSKTKAQHTNREDKDIGDD